MPESPTPVSPWARTNVPPLRADIDRRRRMYRRHLSKIERTGWVTLAALLGTTAGALGAFISSGGMA